MSRSPVSGRLLPPNHGTAHRFAGVSGVGCRVVGKSSGDENFGVTSFCELHSCAASGCPILATIWPKSPRGTEGLPRGEIQGCRFRSVSGTMEYWATPFPTKQHRTRVLECFRHPSKQRFSTELFGFGRRSKQDHIWDLRKPLQAACQRAGIKDLRVHDPRHMATTILLLEGVPEAIIRKLTSHRSRNLEHYEHLSPVADRDPDSECAQGK